MADPPPILFAGRPRGIVVTAAPTQGTPQAAPVAPPPIPPRPKWVVGVPARTPQQIPPPQPGPSQTLVVNPGPPPPIPPRPGEIQTRPRRAYAVGPLQAPFASSPPQPTSIPVPSAMSVPSTSSSSPSSSSSSAQAEDPRKRRFSLPAGAEYRVDRVFLDFSGPAYNVGWKLHVVKPQGLSEKNSRLPACYKDLLTYLVTKGIPHKIVANLDHLERMESNKAQVGKFITIYPDGEAQLKALAEYIHANIPNDPSTNPSAPGDVGIASTGSVSARWGGLTGHAAVDADNKIALDTRRSGCPDYVRNPFDQDSRGIDGWVKFDDDDMETIRQVRAVNAEANRFFTK